MKTEHVVIWADPERDETQEDKAANLLEHLSQYNLEIVSSYKWAPIVVIKASEEQLELLKADSEIKYEANEKVSFTSNNATTCRPINCS